MTGSLLYTYRKTASVPTTPDTEIVEDNENDESEINNNPQRWHLASQSDGQGVRSGTSVKDSSKKRYYTARVTKSTK